jgi:hypothetical protein
MPLGGNCWRKGMALDFNTAKDIAGIAAPFTSAIVET